MKRFFSFISLLAICGCSQKPPTPQLVTVTPRVSTPAPPPKPKAPPKDPRTPIGKMVTTKSGLKYQLYRKGKGPAAKAGQKVTVHYYGMFKDGTQFEASRERGAPIDFVLGAKKVIAGWDEGIVGMQVGEERKLYIPSKLAYGPAGNAGIPPNSDLIFNVELMKLSKP